MDFNKYGPFANIIAIAGALVATFSLLLLKMVGRVKRWTWLTSDSPSLIITFGARMVVIALMAFTYITTDKTNYIIPAILSVIIGLWGLYQIYRFNQFRTLNFIKIPLVGNNGTQLTDKNGQLQFENKIIGSEDNMNAVARQKFIKFQKEKGISLVEFMSGYGTPPNNPESIWNREVLSRISNRITMSLIYIILSGVLVIFWAAIAIEVFTSGK